MLRYSLIRRFSQSNRPIRAFNFKLKVPYRSISDQFLTRNNKILIATGIFACGGGVGLGVGLGIRYDQSNIGSQQVIRDLVIIKTRNEIVSTILKDDQLRKTYFKLANQFFREQQTIDTAKIYVRELLTDKQIQQILLQMMNDSSLIYIFAKIFAGIGTSSK